MPEVDPPPALTPGTINDCLRYIHGPEEKLLAEAIAINAPAGAPIGPIALCENLIKAQGLPSDYTFSTQAFHRIRKYLYDSLTASGAVERFPTDQKFGRMSLKVTPSAQKILAFCGAELSWSAESDLTTRFILGKYTRREGTGTQFRYNLYKYLVARENNVAPPSLLELHANVPSTLNVAAFNAGLKLLEMQGILTNKKLDRARWDIAPRLRVQITRLIRNIESLRSPKGAKKYHQQAIDILDDPWLIRTLLYKSHTGGTYNLEEFEDQTTLMRPPAKKSKTAKHKVTTPSTVKSDQTSAVSIEEALHFLRWNCNEEKIIAQAVAVSSVGKALTPRTFGHHLARLQGHPERIDKIETLRMFGHIQRSLYYARGVLPVEANSAATHPEPLSFCAVEPIASKLLALYGLQLDISTSYDPPLQFLLGSVGSTSIESPGATRFKIYQHLLSTEGQKSLSARDIYTATGVTLNFLVFRRTLRTLMRQGIINYRDNGYNKRIYRVLPKYMAPISELVQGMVLLEDPEVAEAYRDRARYTLSQPQLVCRLLAKHRDYIAQYSGRGQYGFS
jgi:hypothetical protein